MIKTQKIQELINQRTRFQIEKSLSTQLREALIKELKQENSPKKELLERINREEAIEEDLKIKINNINQKIAILNI